VLYRLFARRPSARTLRRSRLLVELLEAREVPSVTLLNIPDQTVPLDKPVYVPVTVENTPNGVVSTTVQSSNSAAVAAEVLTGGRSVRFLVRGTDSQGQEFTGTLTIRLFETAAPLATQRIVDLANTGFYNGKLFHRVLDNFMIQGGSPNGDGIGGSDLPDVADEFHKDFTFASGGLVAMANAGDDNNDSQFFITDIDVPLAQRPQNLNFNHTIVGLLTEGFDTYQKITSTQVTAQPNPPFEQSRPVNPVRILSAVAFNDTAHAVVRLTPQPGYSGGPVTVTVTSTDADGPTGSATETFAVTGVDDGVNSRPFLGPVPATLTTTEGSPVSLTLPFTDIDGDPARFAVRNYDPTTPANDFTTAPPNLNVQIDQASGTVTLTPAAGFTGTFQFKVGVRAPTASDAAASFDTQVVSLTVNPPPPTVPPPPPTVPPPPPASPNDGPITAEGSPAGAEARVTVRNQDGSERFSVAPFAPGFIGGVRTAVADVTGDGTEDVIAVPGDGGAPMILILDSTTGTVLSSHMVFEDTFRGGLFLDTRRVDGRDHALVVVGAGNTGGPRVTVLDASTGEVVLNFFAGDEAFRGGVTADLGQLGPDQEVFIVTGMGPGAGPEVTVWDARTAERVGSFLAGAPDDRGGIRVRVVESETGPGSILVAPFASAGTDGEQAFDPTEFINFDQQR
jgi:cyclophilin family peptidyl-prolyl cis-trans isomerase